MYYIKVVRGRGKGQTVEHAFAPSPHYTVTTRSPQCPAVLEGNETPGIEIEFWPIDSPEQVRVTLPDDGDSVYVTTDQPLRDLKTGDIIVDPSTRRPQGIGRTVDAFHWPLRNA